MARFTLDAYGEFAGEYYKTENGFAWCFGDGTAIPFTWDGKLHMGELQDEPETFGLYAPECTKPTNAPVELVLATAKLISEVVLPYHRKQEARAEERKRKEKQRKALERALKKAKGKSIRY